MTLMSWLALATCITVLSLGGLTLLAERGYDFDLRRKRRKDSIRVGGRRRSDRLSPSRGRPLHRAA